MTKLEEAEERYHEKAYLGKVRMDWTSEFTSAFQGIVNNRAMFTSNINAVLRSMKAFGPQGDRHPIIVIIRKKDLPEGLDLKAAAPHSILTFTSKTMVGIVAGAHRLAALKLFCQEASKVIEGARNYLLALEAKLRKGKMDEAEYQEQVAQVNVVRAKVEQLVKVRDAAAHWPTLIYDWGTSRLDMLSLVPTPSFRSCTCKNQQRQTPSRRAFEKPDLRSQGCERLRAARPALETM